MNYLEVEFRDGTKWIIPTDVIALHCAKERAENGGDFDEEYHSILKDDKELKRWASQKMDWNDVEPYARLLKQDKADYRSDWPYSTMQIIEGD